MDTRGRSRSKTPSINLRVSSDREINGEKLTVKQPDVETINEEDISSRTTLVSVTKTISNDSVLDESRKSNSTPTSEKIEIEVIKRTLVTRHHEYPIIATETITVATESNNIEKHENITTTEVSSTSTLQKEINENEINTIVEDCQTAATIMRTSTPKPTSRSMQIATEIVSPKIDLKEHAAYREYKDAGEYWNTFPKTDFTYSELSPHRREVAPGFIAMPNMSRKSLDKHQDRVIEMISRNPTQESFIRQRYAASDFSTRTRTTAGAGAGYDSQDEVDLSEITQCKKYTRTTTVLRKETTTTVRKFFMSIITFFTSIPHVVSRVFKRSEHNMYYTRIEDDKGIFSKISTSFKSMFETIFTKLYLIISSILCLDTWLLQRSSALEEKGNRKRKMLMGLLVLLPFLLFGAICLAETDERIILPSSAKSPVSLGIALPSFTLPQPKINMLNFGSFNPNAWFGSFTLLPSISMLSKNVANPTEKSLNEKLKIALTESEYNDLIKHVESYVDNILNERYERGNLNVNSQINTKIADTISNYMKMYKHDLSDSDINIIAEKVKDNLMDVLLANNNKPILLSNDNVEQITNLINNHLHVHQSQYVIDEKQMKDILLTILSSEKLIEVIDLRILEKLKQTQTALQDQKILIENLRKELDSIQSRFQERLDSSNLLFIDDLNYLKVNQDKLADQMYNYQIENSEKYLKATNEMEIKLLSLKEQQTAKIDDIVKANILAVLSEKNLSDENLKTWVQHLFVAKDDLDSKLNELNLNVNNLADENIKNLGAILMKEISAKIKTDMIEAINGKNNGKNAVSVGINEADVKRMVRDALAVYDADKTGLVDYALESAGGQILSTRCTENFQTRTAQISIFGIPLWYPTNTPRTVIKPSMQPGECWAFQGFPGYLVIQLNSEVLVTGFTVEHIPKMLAPNGLIDSAPKSFTVWGLKAENDDSPVLFGNYEFLDNNSSLQYFPVQNKDVQLPFRLIELRIESNHGNVRYTCLYRFRVHGSRV